MGWISATGDRANRRSFFDIFTQRGEPRFPTDRETLAGLALAKTVGRC